MQAEINRRDLLVLAGRATLVGAVAAVYPGCSSGDAAASDAQLSAAVRARVGDMPGARKIAEAAGMEQAEALRALRGGASDREVTAAIASGDALVEFVNARRSEDFDAGRVRLVRGWRLAETEVAIATLASD